MNALNDPVRKKEQVNVYLLSSRDSGEFRVDKKSSASSQTTVGREARRSRNEINRLDNQGWDWDKIKSTVTDSANHVKNTTQLTVASAVWE